MPWTLVSLIVWLALLIPVIALLAILDSGDLLLGYTGIPVAILFFRGIAAVIKDIQENYP